MNPSAKAAGLQLGTCACRDRPHDGGPAAYVERSVGIGVGNVGTACRFSRYDERCSV
jgi:hypothetical protein